MLIAISILKCVELIGFIGVHGHLLRYSKATLMTLTFFNIGLV